MRKFLLLYFLLFSLVSFGQQTIGVFIPKDDGSPFDWQTKHMWVGKQNPISSNYIGDEEFIKLWTDNGTIDTGDFYLCKYAVVPQKTGTVNVYTIQRVRKANHYDTVKTKTTFEAILPPKISIKLINGNLAKDSAISFILVDYSTLKPISKRYQIAGFYEPLVYDKEGNLIGQLSMCSGTKIDFTDPMHSSLNLKKDYSIKLLITVRDRKTDLLIPIEEFVYQIK